MRYLSKHTWKWTTSSIPKMGSRWFSTHRWISEGESERIIRWLDRELYCSDCCHFAGRLRLKIKVHSSGSSFWLSACFLRFASQMLWRSIQCAVELFLEALVDVWSHRSDLSSLASYITKKWFLQLSQYSMCHCKRVIRHNSNKRVRWDLHSYVVF